MLRNTVCANATRKAAKAGGPLVYGAFCSRGNPSSNHRKSDNSGLISVDRNNKATLPLTIPGRTFKSYAKDLS